MAQAAAYGAAELEAQPVGVAVVPAESRGFGGRTRLALCSVSLLAAAALALARSGTGALSSGAAARLDSSYSTDDDALDYFLEYGCGYDDDDAYFLSDTGCISGDAWTCENRLYSNDAADDDGPVPYFTNGSLCYDSCSTSLERTWGVPCAWQLIADMPSMCAGTAKPNVTRLLDNRDLAPSESPVYFKQGYGSEGKTQTQYDCNLHAFCSACSYANGTVNKYCAATVKYYNSFEMTGRVMIHADEFWCDDEVLAAIDDGLDTFTEKYGKHKSWWNSTVRR